MVIKEPPWKTYLVEATDPVFSIDECNKIIDLGQNLPQRDARIGGPVRQEGKKNYKIRKTAVAWIPFKQAHWMYARVEHWMHIVNNKHMGFYQLQLGEVGQFSSYSKKQHYDWHTDSNYEMSKEPTVRKMSMCILLNDPKEFKGGEFQIVDHKRTLSLKQGYAIFFASFIPHRVLPVKKGTRHSLTMWFGGPPLI